MNSDVYLGEELHRVAVSLYPFAVCLVRYGAEVEDRVSSSVERMVLVGGVIQVYYEILICDRLRRTFKHCLTIL